MFLEARKNGPESPPHIVISKPFAATHVKRHPGEGRDPVRKELT